MTLALDTRYMTFPRSKVFHKMGSGSRTLCGLDTLRKGGQIRMFVLYALVPIEGKTYCENCRANEFYTVCHSPRLLRRCDAKVQT